MLGIFQGRSIPKGNSAIIVGGLVFFACILGNTPREVVAAGETVKSRSARAKEQKLSIKDSLLRARKLYREGKLLDAWRTLLRGMEWVAVEGRRSQFQDAARLYYLTCRDGAWLGTYLRTFRKLMKAKKLPEKRHRMVVFRLAHGLASTGKTKQAKKHLPGLPEGGAHPPENFEDAYELCVYAETGVCGQPAKAYRYAIERFKEGQNWYEEVWAGKGLYSLLDATASGPLK